MLHNLDLSVALGEAAHYISVDLSMQEPRQVTLRDVLVRSFGSKCCVVEDLDPPSRRVYLLLGRALALLDRKPALSGEQKATAREPRERVSQPEGQRYAFGSQRETEVLAPRAWALTVKAGV